MVFALNSDMRFSQGRGEALGGFQGLYNAKVRGLRYTSFESVTNYGIQAQQVGLKCLVIVTGESKGFVWGNGFTPDYVQLNNEPDITMQMKTQIRSLSLERPRLGIDTWLDPSDMADFWVTYRNTYKDLAHKGVKFFGPGLASGGQNAVDYWAKVDKYIGKRAPKPDALALHEYNKEPEEAAGDFDLMWNAFGTDVIGTEWYRSAASGQMWDFIAMLNDPQTGRSTDWNSFFCLDNTMVMGFGLCDNGIPNDQWYSLMSSPSIP